MSLQASTTQPITTTYEGIQIAYWESKDVWTFELRGRQRSADSLAKAKEAIDRPAPAEKKEFKRVKAWKASYSDTFSQVVVTSLAESGYSSPEAWISEKGQRKKEYVSKLYADTPENAERVKSHADLLKQVEELEKRARAIVGEMDKFNVEGYE